jgi:hypothetical protein
VSGAPSSSATQLQRDIDQLRVLLTASLGQATPRSGLEQAMGTLARIEQGAVPMAHAHERERELEAEVEQLRMQLREALKLIELQKADLDRYKATCESLEPNQPERVPAHDLQHALKRILESFGDTPAANDLRALGDVAPPPEPPASGDAQVVGDPTKPGEGGAPPEKTKGGRKKRRHAHGRRRLDLTTLPVEIVTIDPEEVRKSGGEGWKHIGDEVSERIAYKPGSYIRLRIVRRKWARADTVIASGHGGTTGVEAPVAAEETPAPDLPTVVVAPLPDGVWPHGMADPSAIAQVIESKYDDTLPLNRQESISIRQGFALPRSTQCGWLGAAYDVCYRVVDAMFEEGKANAFCIATDATGARVRPKTKGPCEDWHVFVFIADRDHVVFRYAKEHSGSTIESFLEGFQGYLLADAAPIYDVLHRDHDIIEVCCWFHARRYFWRAIASDRERALEALALIGKLFEVQRSCRDVPMPGRTQERAHKATPILALFDAWIERHRAHVDPRGPLDKAIGYYDNQRDALRRFLEDGRLRLDNNISEGALRNLVLGRHNYQWFANETGLRWYTTFRSLIASCSLHGLNAQDYLEQLLRLAPHWPVTRVLELAPKYWARTLAQLDEHQRAILVRPWELGNLKAGAPTPIHTNTITVAA